MASLEEVVEKYYHTTKNGRSYERYKIKCKSCGEIVDINKGRLKRFKYCSKDCAMDILNPVTESIKFNCQVCGVECDNSPSQYAKSKVHFCSHNCSDKYRSIIKTVYNKCTSCKNWFPVRKSTVHQITCSRKCQGIWQSKNLVREKANNYTKGMDDLRFHKCDWCGEVRSLLPSDIKNKIDNGKKYFCSKKCYREWYAKDWSQQDSWKEKSRERALNMLADGTFNKTDTLPQKILNAALEKLGIKFVNEYKCGKVAIDNYLSDHNLMIEVNGRYWHCDPRFYNLVSYQRQYDRIVNDKRKNAAIKSEYDINILYLWEDDLTTNLDMCMMLILSYIENKGILDNYHSFNYRIYNEKLKLNSHIIMPYSEYVSESLHKIFVPVDGKKRSRKQNDKWITFQCDYCGENKEQLITHYNKSITHCCSKACSYELKKASSVQ